MSQASTVLWDRKQVMPQASTVFLEDCDVGDAASLTGAEFCVAQGAQSVVESAEDPNKHIDDAQTDILVESAEDPNKHTDALGP
eukprot:1121681-Lingulodinium_polyedra.AAC.1